MLKSVVEAYPDQDISIHVVWLPMLPSDNEAAAKEICTMFDDPRVHQYWDPGRLSGIAYTRVYPKMFRDMAASMPDDHALAKLLKAAFEQRGAVPPEQAPLWDVAFFNDREATWQAGAPKTDEWVKQIAFMPGRGDGVTGTFWLDDFAKPPANSDWHVELSNSMKQLMEKSSKPKAKRPEGAVEVTSLVESLEPLREHFNQSKDRLRFVTLLSPT